MKYSIFLVFCLTAVCSWAKWAPPADILLNRDEVIQSAAKVTAERFPDADDVLLDDSIFEKVEKDGTSVMWDDQYTKILTEKGRRSASTDSMYFTAHYGTAFVHRVELIKPNGKIVQIDHKANSRVMIDSSQMGSNIYDPDSKILTVSIPGVEIGDICHLIRVRVNTKTRMPNAWCDYNLFEYTSPIRKMDYRVSMPPELPLKHQILRAPVANTVAASKTKQADGRILYHWKVRNVPRMFPEPDMPSLATQVQRLMVSTIGSWKDVSKWYWNLCKPQLDKVTPDMREKVASLIRGAKSRDEKIRRIFKFVSQEIRYMGITIEDVAPGYEPHDVSMTFKNRYGVCRDKAALLVSMLRLADIPAYPVLIHVGDKRDPDVPLPFFNHAITGVDDGKGGYRLMDSTNEGTRDIFPAYLGNKSFLVARPEGDSLHVSDVYPAEKNLVRIRTTGVMEKNGSALLKTSLAFDGINDTVYRGFFLRKKQEDRRTFFERHMKKLFPGAELLSCEIYPENLQDTDQAFKVDLTTRVKSWPVRGEGTDLLPLPWLGTSLGYVNFVIGSTGLEKRKYPFMTELTCGVQEEVDVSLADAMGAPRHLPKAVNLNRNGHIFTLSYQLKDQHLKAKRAHLMKSVEFSPDQYLALKEDLRTKEAAGRKRLLFAPKSEHTPDQEYLSFSSVIHIDSPTKWTEDRVCTQRILTYAGKKNASEIQIGYNPIRETVRLLSATVSNITGEVKTVTPKEINLMDAGWVGSAPRYPAAKTMVISLPGVEVGSVISVSLRLSNTNAWFYSKKYQFGSETPVKNESYAIDTPIGLDPRIRVYHGENLTASVQTNGTRILRTWKGHDFKIVPREPLSAPWHYYQPTVALSFGNWKDYAQKLFAAADQAEKSSQKARAFARQLTKDTKGDRAKLLKIRNEIFRLIRVSGPSFLQLPPDVAFSTPDRTLADRYGHAADRALLLCVMLKEVGLDAELIFASDDTTETPFYCEPLREIPSSHYFSEPTVRVHFGGHTYVINEGDQYSELGTTALNHALALTRKGQTEKIWVEAPLQNRSLENLVVELDEKGTGRVTVTNWYFGTSVGSFRKRYDEMLPEDRRRHHLELVSGYARSARPISPLKTETKAYPGFRTYQMEVPNYAVVDDHVLTLQLSALTAALFPLLEDQRETPMFFTARTPKKHTCRIVFPKGFVKEEMVPPERTWTLPNGIGTFNVKMTRETLPDGRRCITVERLYQPACGMIPSEQYPGILEYNRLRRHPSMGTFIFSKE